jgi:hypothetical protein
MKLETQRKDGGGLNRINYQIETCFFFVEFWIVQAARKALGPRIHSRLKGE